MDIVYPFDGSAVITQPFGVNKQNYVQFGLEGHNGVDFGIWTGTVIKAVMDMTILEVANDPPGYGLYVKGLVDELPFVGANWLVAHGLITLDSGWHNLVVVGQHVVRGQPLLVSDNSGNSSGPHLHLGWRPPGANRANGFNGYENPLPILEWLHENPPVDPKPIEVLPVNVELALKVAESVWNAAGETFNPDGAIPKQFAQALVGGHYWGEPSGPELNVDDNCVVQAFSNGGLAVWTGGDNVLFYPAV